MATVKERVIKRLNKGFGFNIPQDARWHTHERGFRANGGLSWYFVDIRLGHLQNCGSASPATECLKWEKWCINTDDAEIFEFFECDRKLYEARDFLIEGNTYEQDRIVTL